MVEQDEKVERWRYPTPPNKLDTHQIRDIMSVVIAQMVRITMTTNFYEWEGQLYRKLVGAPTGLSGSFPISRIVMDFWAKEIKNIVAKSK